MALLLTAAAIFASLMPAPLHADPFQLRLDRGSTVLQSAPLPKVGAVFVLAAPDLATLANSPSILFQSNTPLPTGLRAPLPARLDFAGQGFFRAATWDGLAPALVDIPAGTFLMGTPGYEAEVFPWEGPQTAVTLTHAFKMGRYEVTQAEYQAVMGANPSYFTGLASRPVEQVTWANAMDYCQRLTASQRAAGCLPPGWLYRLPTEAEWEYACRAGTATTFAYGPALRSGMANFVGSQEFDGLLGTILNPLGVTAGKPVPVGAYAPNAWGLCDMHGNVWEWCLDSWSDTLPGGQAVNPRGDEPGPNRVVRGGCWYNAGRICRSGYRAKSNSGYRGNETGFRVVLAPE